MRAVKRWALGLPLLGLLALPHCHKSPPNELVYTGRKAGGGGGPTPAPTTTVTPPPPPPDEVPPPPPGGFDKAALLGAIADCAVERYRAFDTTAKALRDAAKAQRDAPSEANATAAKDAWLAAMAQWEEAELFSFGPGGRIAATGGQNLRDPIYSWPAVSRCRVEEQLVAETYATPEFGTSLVNGRGLAAYEYLAFYGASDNVCSAFSTINSTGSWNALGSALATRKAAYAAAVAEDVATSAAAILAAWEPSRGNFRAELATAGTGSRVFASPQDAFNAITEAIFYLEKIVKDLKLGRPLGYIECPTATCPEGLESLYANAGTAHLKANLAGFRRIFQGCGEKGAGLGFDDWLTEVGAGDLANRMIATLIATQAAVDALDPPLEQSIKTNPAPVAALHATLRALTDPLKTELITVLNLELPKSSEGDND